MKRKLTTKEKNWSREHLKTNSFCSSWSLSISEPPQFIKYISLNLERKSFKKKFVINKLISPEIDIECQSWTGSFFYYFFLNLAVYDPQFSAGGHFKNPDSAQGMFFLHFLWVLPCLLKNKGTIPLTES